MRSARATAGLLAVAALAGCAAPQSRELLRAPPPGLQPRAELTTVAFYPQTRYHCGPAALATVLDYRGIVTDPQALAPEVYLPERKGSLQIEIVAAARRRALLPYPLAPQLGDLLAEVAAGNPVLVMQNLGLDWLPTWHYAVVVGFDLETGTVVLRSGTEERHTVSLATFERTWARSDRWALVITRPGEPPPTAEHDTWLRTAFDLEQTGQPRAALEAYRAATTRWPRSVAAHLAYGNAAYHEQDMATATRAFLDAVGLAPRQASAWNNLAWALHGAGCAAQADAALQCATTIAPDDATVRASRDELARETPTRDGRDCPVVACP